MKKRLLLLLILLVGCQNGQPSTLKRYQRGTFDAGFDTYVELAAYAKDENAFDTTFKEMTSEFYRYNQIFDNYKTYDDALSLMAINQHAGKGAIKVDQALIDVLEFVKTMHDQGYTKFDPTMGAVLEIWHEYRTAGILANQNGDVGKTPSMTILETANLCTGWENIVIDATNSTVEITNPCTKLDLGGIAKGYAAEQVAQYLESKGTQYAIVNPGGNIRTINTRADGNPWNIAIQKPTLLQDDGNIDVLSIPESMSMVTSGDYQRAYENEDGLRLHHLIDPDTLMPTHYFRSVTVITKNSMVADFFSTQLFLIPYQQGVELIHQYNQQHPQEPLHALWIIDDETITQHEDFFTVDEVDYQISMTENLQPYSRQYQKHHD